MSSAIELFLPRPPSANNLWRKGRNGLYLSKPYKNWLERVDNIVKVLEVKPSPIIGPYNLILYVGGKEGERGDIDNFFKATSDVLKRLGMIEDDKWARRVSAEWSGMIVKGTIFVVVEPVGAILEERVHNEPPK